MIPLQPFMPWKVSMTVLHTLAVLSTCLRLWHRRRTRKLWWDDLATVLPAVLEILNMAILWLRIRHHPETSLKYRVLLSYGNSVCYISINWWSRISLAFAVVRITPSWTTSRRLAVGMTILFVLFWMGLLTTMITACVILPEWQHNDIEIPICGPGLHITVAITVLDIIGDIALIAIPLNLLWHMNHHSSQRRLVRLVFSASVLTLLASLFLVVVSYADFMVGPGKLIVWLMVCYITEAISVITSNLLVLVCWLYQYLAKDGEPADDSDVYITPHWSRNRHPHSEKGTATKSQMPAQLGSAGAAVAEGASSDASSYDRSSCQHSKEKRNEPA